MKLTPTEALKRINISADTLYKDMKRGKLSFEKKGSRKRLIDVSELERVYGPLTTEDQLISGHVSPDVSTDKRRISAESPARDTEIALLRQQVALLEEDRRREREQLQDQIDDLKETVKNAREHQTRLTALLSDQRQERDKKEAQEQAQLMRELRVGYSRLRQELNEVREQKGFLARWFRAGDKSDQPSTRSGRRPVHAAKESATR